MSVNVSLGYFFFMQKTAYEMRISDWSSDVCSSDLGAYQARIVFGIARSRSRLRDNGSPVARERQPDLPGRRSGGKDDGHLDDVASQRQARLSRAAGLGILERSARRRASGPPLEQRAVSPPLGDALPPPPRLPDPNTPLEG